MGIWFFKLKLKLDSALKKFNICVMYKIFFSGPLMYKTQNNMHVLIGVVSFGPHGCIDSTLPNVYARVTEVLDWIFTYIKTSKTCLPTNVELNARLNHHYWYSTRKLSSKANCKWKRFQNICMIVQVQFRCQSPKFENGIWDWRRGTWRWVGQWTLIMKIYDFFIRLSCLVTVCNDINKKRKDGRVLFILL